MGHSTREEIMEAFAAADNARNLMGELTFDVLTTPELLRAMERELRNERRSRATRHTLINQLLARATKEELGGTPVSALAERLRITKADAGRWIAEAHDLGPRLTLSGEPLEALLNETAAAQRDGMVDDGHVKLIRSFMAHLPVDVDAGTREQCEADLARQSRGFRPEQVTKYAQKLLDYLHPDGDYTDEERARKRGLTLSEQQHDGMTRLTGLITDELRAEFEAMLAKLAAPGMCNPQDHTPVLDDEPGHDAIGRDTRSTEQRNHDALLYGIKTLFKSGALGQHNGLPVTIIVTADLKDVEKRTGTALTAGGTRVPMSTVFRWTGQADHYLAVFDGAKAQALYHKNRLANRAQRIMFTPRTAAARDPAATLPLTTPRSTTSAAGRTPTPPTSTTSPWPAAPTTDSPKTAGPLESTTPAMPNGYRQPISTTDSHASIRSITRSDSSGRAMMMTTNLNSGRP